jgi:hypothetical protein
MIDISLPRAAFKEYGNRQKFLPFFNGAEQARRGTFPYVPLPVKIFVVTLPGRNEMRINVQFVAFDGNLAVDHGAAAGMIW